MHIEAVSNGMGGPSMYLLWLACQRKIPATVSITADTGFELDCLVSTGERMSAEQFFARHIKPLASAYGIDAYFVRAVTRDKKAMPGLLDYHREYAMQSKAPPLFPMFGTHGGRSLQRCTQRYKVTPIRQQLRRLGATTQRSAQGLHRDEIHRMRGADQRTQDGFMTWTDLDGPRRPVKWCSHYYPLIELGLSRTDIRRELTHEGIPFILGSQCDGCPHKNLERWLMTSPQKLIELAEIERDTPGWYFTNLRIPLLDAIEVMKSKPQRDSDFGCGNAVCGL